MAGRMSGLMMTKIINKLYVCMYKWTDRQMENPKSIMPPATAITSSGYKKHINIACSSKVLAEGVSPRPFYRGSG